MTPLFSEILDEIAKAKTKDKKIKILKENNTEALRMVLKSSFDPNIEWALPEGEVPYIKNDAPAGTEHTVLAQEAKKLYHYIKGGNSNLNQSRRELMFVQLLEGLHESEADLIVAAKDKVLHQKYKGLSANVVREAFNWDDNFMVEEVIYPQTPGLANG